MEFKQQQQQERIFENTCVAVNIKTKKILAMQITDEHLRYDGKALPESVDSLLKSDKTLGKLFADDGASEGNDIFRCLGDDGYAMH